MNILSKFITKESEMIVRMFAQYISTYLGMNTYLPEFFGTHTIKE